MAFFFTKFTTFAVGNIGLSGRGVPGALSISVWAQASLLALTNDFALLKLVARLELSVDGLRQIHY